MDFREQVEAVKAQALQACKAAESPQSIESIRVQYLGKKGELTSLLRGLGKMSPEDRPLAGKWVNEAKEELEGVLKEYVMRLQQEATEKRLLEETIDISLPGRQKTQGSLHPINMVLDEIIRIFVGMGYQVAEGPEIEQDYYNFEALNVPKDHPARDMQDTFYFNDMYLLRSQTSPVQVRTMENQEPPVRIIAPGKVYRSDSDITHSPMFHQVEGLIVDDSVTMADLKGTLQTFAEKMFGTNTKTRFRSSYFPFTEPSAEVDVSCIMCGGTGCRVCSQTGWLEILGSGMVDPRVLEMVGYDPERVSGFAFGMGVERIAMLKYGIHDIRLLFDNDVRFLHQFSAKGGRSE